MLLSDIIHRDRHPSPAPGFEAEIAELAAEAPRWSAEPGEGRWEFDRRVRNHDRRRKAVEYNLPGQ